MKTLYSLLIVALIGVMAVPLVMADAAPPQAIYRGAASSATIALERCEFDRNEKLNSDDWACQTMEIGHPRADFVVILAPVDVIPR